MMPSGQVKTWQGFTWHETSVLSVHPDDLADYLDEDLFPPPVFTLPCTEPALTTHVIGSVPPEA